MMPLGRTTATAILSFAVTGCDLVLPLPEAYLAEEGGLDVLDPDAFVVDANWDATVDTHVDAECGDGDVEDADGGAGFGDASLNPCPDPGRACCGWTPDAGPGDLLCRGLRCEFDPQTCEKCLALDCNPEEQFCCAPGGDSPPACLDWGAGCN